MKTVWITGASVGVMFACLTFTAADNFASAHDDGRYAGSPLKSWFDQLQSGKGRCCSDADGTALSDPDWGMSGGKYRVRINGEWLDVPSDALVTEPNRYGQAMVWPDWMDGKPQIRCFMAGAAG